MSEPFMFEKPLGMRDILPGPYQMQKRIAGRVQSELEKWGYEQVQTPALEYFETVGKSSAISDKQLFKLIDSQIQPILRLHLTPLHHHATGLFSAIFFDQSMKAPIP
jgi:ATP phosphoribosyltransferase regulatory subunit